MHLVLLCTGIQHFKEDGKLPVWVVRLMLEPLSKRMVADVAGFPDYDRPQWSIPYTTAEAAHRFQVGTSYRLEMNSISEAATEAAVPSITEIARATAKSLVVAHEKNNAAFVFNIVTNTSADKADEILNLLSAELEKAMSAKKA